MTLKERIMWAELAQRAARAAAPWWKRGLYRLLKVKYMRLGICHELGNMRLAGEIDGATFSLGLDEVLKESRLRSPQPGRYLWSRDVEGYRQRAAWCRRRASGQHV